MIEDLISEPDFDLHWQMTSCERYALIGLLKRVKPKFALEVGTYLGGSLQVIARYSERVVSIDIDPTVSSRLAHRFDNVEFRTGDSQIVLPELINEVNCRGGDLDFVLIDGDHSNKGILRDIKSVLQLRPQGRVVIVMHDSFNPDCRAGMKSVVWNDYPFVHSVELDFIPGVYHFEAFDTAQPRTMWGGFACAVLFPQVRLGPVVVKESQRQLFDAVRADSVHATPNRRQQLIHQMRRVLRKAAKVGSLRCG